MNVIMQMKAQISLHIFDIWSGTCLFLNTVYSIALDKLQFPIQKYWYFYHFSMKTYAVGTH